MTMILDQNRIKDLDSLNVAGEPDIFSMVAEPFLERGISLLINIQTGIRTHDFSLIHFNAHALKSSCLTLGAPYLAGLCWKLETLAQDKDKNCFSLGRITAIEAEFKEVCIALQNLLEQRKTSEHIELSGEEQGTRDYKENDSK